MLVDKTMLDVDIKKSAPFKGSALLYIIKWITVYGYVSE